MPRCCPSSLMPATLIALAAACSSSSGPDSIEKTTGQATDLAGDGGGADLTLVLFEVAGRTVTAVATFDPGTYQADSVLAVFDLDVDENPATGFTTAEPGYAGLGIDYRLEVGNIDPATTRLGARIKRYEGGTFVTVQEQPIAVNEGGFVASVSYDAFHDTDDRLAFRVETSRVLPDGTRSARQDWAPEPAAAPVTVR